MRWSPVLAGLVLLVGTAASAETVGFTAAPVAVYTGKAQFFVGQETPIEQAGIAHSIFLTSGFLHLRFLHYDQHARDGTTSGGVVADGSLAISNDVLVMGFQMGQSLGEALQLALMAGLGLFHSRYVVEDTRNDGTNTFTTTNTGRSDQPINPGLVTSVAATLPFGKLRVGVEGLYLYHKMRFASGAGTFDQNIGGFLFGLYAAAVF